MSDHVLVYEPVPPRDSNAHEAHASLDGIAGKVVAFIDNAKPNFNHLVDDLADLLVARHGVTAVVKRRKSAASVPAPDSVVRELAEHCDVVITGSGD